MLKMFFSRLFARPSGASAQPLYEQGLDLMKQQRHDEARACFERALALRPGWTEALYRHGNALLKLKRPADALASYDQLLAQQPDFADALYNRGLVLQELNRHEAAVESYRRLLAVKPDDIEALNNRANSLMVLRRFEEGLAGYQKALQLDPAFPHALFNSGVAFQELGRPERSVQMYERLMEHAADYPLARGKLLHTKMLCCDWQGLAELVAAVQADVRAGRQSADPFGYLATAESSEDLLACMKLHAREFVRPPPPAPARRKAGGKIRLGYVCGEFRLHATSMLMIDVYERHDRERFELIAFDNGARDDSPMRRRIEAAFDEIVDIRGLSDAEAAAAIRDRNIDILVDLNGYFGQGRPAVFGRKPAPLQVNYLGFPGTLGAPYMDYIVADLHVIPAGDERWYVEKVVRLPDTYQANSRREIAPSGAGRADAGLPEDGFVFCCFNNNWKLTPQVFDVWMRLLGAVAGSVLWLLEDNPAASANLRQEAQKRGVDPARLVFARRLPPDQHLARHALADLFLDTLPCNAHTTASDALWAGLPLLTCSGATFAGRVATSLLHAIGLPELVTNSLAEYEQMALALALAPDRLADIRTRLTRHRETYPLFDSDRLCRHLEQAYATMWQRHQQGEPPQAFAVQPVPGGGHRA